MLTIRLQRAGKKNKADFRVVLAEKTAASQKKFTEVLGSYNPHTKALNIRNPERLNYWVDEQHVELSATVRNLFVSNNLVKGDKAKAFTIPKKEVVVVDENNSASSEAQAETEASAEQVAEATEENVPAEVETSQTEAEPVAPAAEETPSEAPTETSTPAEESNPEAAPETTKEKSA